MNIFPFGLVGNERDAMSKAVEATLTNDPTATFTRYVNEKGDVKIIEHALWKTLFQAGRTQ